jgi:putative ATP-dependent endonuclease of the OLD family
MKIKTLRIQNFRSFEDQTLDLGDYTCLVGANGSGKSNVLHALNVFFGEGEIPGLNTRQLGEEDFHNRRAESPIEISVTFDDLSAEAREDLKHYVRQGQLTVSAQARFDRSTGRAELKQYGQRLAIRAFGPFFEAEKQGKKVQDLKGLYGQIAQQFSELPKAATKDAMMTIADIKGGGRG